MKRSTIACTVALLSAWLMVAGSRARVAEAEADVREKSSVYTLPSPKVLERLSMGYRAALSDYLWAHVLVTQGLRMGERRPFPEIGAYLDAINHLDPQFREPYRLTDSIMSFQVKDPDRVATLVRVRGILERGLLVFPYDPELWLNYGQFLAYIAPGSFDDPKMSKEWRQDGAQAIVRAGELGGYDEAMSFRTMSAATILNREGERDAAIRFLERAYTIVESEEAKEQIRVRLEALREGRQRSRQVVLSEAFDKLWREDLPFVSRPVLSVIGPSTNTWACAGPDRTEGERCERSWTAWSEDVFEHETQR